MKKASKNMIEGGQFIQIVKTYFDFLITEFDFIISEEKIRGNMYYDINYSDLGKIVSVSYENIEDYLLIIVFILDNGNLPHYDDKTKTLHIDKLFATILQQIDKEEINANDEHFSKFSAHNELEIKLLKGAKELRLCLNHFDLYK